MNPPTSPAAKSAPRSPRSIRQATATSSPQQTSASTALPSVFGASLSGIASNANMQIELPVDLPGKTVCSYETLSGTATLFANMSLLGRISASYSAAELKSKCGASGFVGNSATLELRRLFAGRGILSSRGHACGATEGHLLRREQRARGGCRLCCVVSAHRPERRDECWSRRRRHAVRNSRRTPAGDAWESSPASPCPSAIWMQQATPYGPSASHLPITSARASISEPEIVSTDE